MSLGYKAFFETLHTACLQADSGVIHLFTQDGQYGKIGLAAGVISHLSLHTFRGMAALPLLAKAQVSAHRLEMGAVLPAQEGLSKTLNLLTTLEEGMSNTGLKSMRTQTFAAINTGSYAAKPLAPPATAAAPATALSPAAIACVEQELTVDLGPMAPSLLKEQLRKARSPLHLAELLAEQLTPAEGRQFLARVGNRLAALS